MRQVANAIIIRDSAILMVRHEESGLWVLPGGKVENEETARQGLRRELSEELPGFLPGSVSYYHTISGTTPSSHEEKEFLFYRVEGTGSVVPSAEVKEALWVGEQGVLATTEVTTKVLTILQRDGLI